MMRDGFLACAERVSYAHFTRFRRVPIEVLVVECDSERPFDVPAHVVTLFASQRGIEVLPASFVVSHTCLVHLDLNNNRLRNLPSCVSLLVSLESLLLFANDLRRLPTSLAHLTYLRSLNLRCNDQLPARVARQSADRHQTARLVRVVVAAFRNSENMLRILCSRQFQDDSVWRRVSRDVIRLIYGFVKRPNRK